MAAAKKSGQFTYGSAGVGSATHWAAERLRLSGGYEATHVPFKGGPEALTEVMAGRVDFTCMGISAALPLIRDGKLMALAVSSGARSAALPNVPTTLEAGLKDSDYNYWMGLFVPSKTPRAIVDKLYAETQKALATPAVQDKFKPQGIEPLKMTSAEFDAMIKREVASQHRARQRRQAEVQLKRLPSPRLMLRRRVSAVSKHEAAPPFETRTSCAPQDEGGAMPYPAWLRSSSSIEMPCGPRMKQMRTPGRTVVGSLVNSQPLALSSAATASMPLTRGRNAQARDRGFRAADCGRRFRR